MSKNSGDRRKKKHSRPSSRSKPSGSDHAVYVVLMLVGAFGLMLWWLASPETWKYALIGYLLAVAFYLNHSVWMVYQGQHLPNWRASLARLPLRAYGYGRKGGKPLEAAHDQPETRTALMVSIILCVVLIAAAWTFLIGWTA